MIDELTREFQRATKSTYYNDGRRAVCGLADGTIYAVNEAGTTDYDRIHIRYDDDGSPAGTAIVYKGNVAPVKDLPIRIKEINGVLQAFNEEIGLRVIRYFQGSGGNRPVGPHTHERLGILPDYVEGLRITELLVRPSSPQALTVYVTAGAYRWKSAQPIFWQGGDSGSLSAYVPLAPGVVHFVVIALDRDTNTIAIIDGNDTAGTDPLFPAVATYDEIEAVPIAAKYYPLAVVHLAYGQTAVKAKDITCDYRLWGSEVSTDLIDSIVIDANGNPVADANGNLLIGIV